MSHAHVRKVLSDLNTDPEKIRANGLCMRILILPTVACRESRRGQFFPRIRYEDEVPYTFSVHLTVKPNCLL